MENPDRETEGSELESPVVQVGSEPEMAEDDSQSPAVEVCSEHDPQEPERQLQDDQPGDVKEVRKTSLTGSDNYESIQILQPKVEKHEESIQNASEEQFGSTGMEHVPADSGYQQSGATPASTQMADDAATEEVSEPSTTIDCRTSTEEIVENVPAEQASEYTKGVQKAIEIEGNKEIAEQVEDPQNVPEPEQELQVQQVEPVMELVLEEAAICVERQERMEQVDDIEEPQKYESIQILQSKVEKHEESIQSVSEEQAGSTGMEHVPAVSGYQKSGATPTSTQMADDAATEQVSEQSTTIDCRTSTEEIVENVPAEQASESTKRVQKAIEIAEQVEDPQNAPEPEQKLQVQQVEPVVELVLEEAAICVERQERMEQVDDIEEPQKYAFREKAFD